VAVAIVAVFTCFFYWSYSGSAVFFGLFISVIFCLTDMYGWYGIPAYRRNYHDAGMADFPFSNEAETDSQMVELTPDPFGKLSKTAAGANWRIRTVARGWLRFSRGSPTGRLAICGGEVSDASGSVTQDFNNTCEIYDPGLEHMDDVRFADAAGIDTVLESHRRCIVCTPGRMELLLMGSVDSGKRGKTRSGHPDVDCYDSPPRRGATAMRSPGS